MNSSINSPVEFEISTVKVLLRLLVGPLFVVGGAFLWQSGEHAVAAITIATFGAGTIFGIRYLYSRKPGLVLTSEGMLINSKVGIGGLVPWREVTGLSLLRYAHAWFLIVKIKSPDTYLTQGGAVRRFLASRNSATFGSPVRITTSLLRGDPQPIFNSVNEFWAHFGNAQPNAQADGLRPPLS